MMKEITFEAVYGIASIKGYVFEEELYEEDCIHYLETSHPRTPAYEKDYAKLKEAIDEDFMFLQWLHDFQDEKATIDVHGKYILNINGGREIDLHVEPYPDKLFNTKVTINYGYSVLNDELLKLFGEFVSANEEYAYDKGENTVYVHIKPEAWEDKDEILESMQEDAEWVYTLQLIEDKEIYWTFYCLLEHYLIEHDDPRAADTSFIWDCADAYEQNMETCKLEYLNNLCFEEIVEGILSYIKERFPYE